MATPQDDVIETLKAAAGDGGWLADDATGKYLVDERDHYRGRTLLVLRPDSTERVAACVRICAEQGIGIVPQGGNTGYCGGATPDDSGSQVVLSLERMNKVRGIDAANHTMTVEAGCILADVQNAAENEDLLFPLSLGAEGSCQIGGNLSTNAGGVNVLRYGNARDLVLGLEVVLPDGEILDVLRRLRKDNTGYDLKYLFLGSEGTLGIVTAAVLKLFPRPRATQTALVAVPSPAAAVKLLTRMRAASGDGVTSFEYLTGSCMDLVTETMEDIVDPMDTPHDHYVLIELSSGRDDGSLQQAAEAALEGAFEAEEVVDAVIAQSGQQRDALWAIRENLPEAQKRAGGSIKHDVSVPVSKVPEFLSLATAKAEEIVDHAWVTPFGHLGDGNIHFNLTKGKDVDAAGFQAHAESLNAAIHGIAVGLGGSFSAEHGIGKLKRGELETYKDPVGLQLMRTLKTAIDPKGIMNPGKIVDPRGG